MEVEEQTDSQWIGIDNLSKFHREPHIMDLLQSSSLSIGEPLDIRMRRSNIMGVGIQCILPRFQIQLQSADDAKACIEKLNEFEMENNDGCKIKVKQIECLPNPEYKKRLETSKMLQITNLNPNVTEKQLTQHIRKKTKVTPESVEIRHNLDGGVPSFAFVQIGNLEDKQKVIKKLRMSSFHGQKMWIRQHGGFTVKRHADLKGKRKQVLIRHLPLDMNDPSEIAKMCSKYGKVDNVILLRDQLGYFRRTANVEMSSNEEADALYDGLHEKEINGCTITTEYDRFNGRQTRHEWLYIFAVSESVNREDICKFVKQGEDERPVHVQMTRIGNQKSKMMAEVAFSKIGMAFRCLMKLKGKKIDGNTVKLTTTNVVGDPRIYTEIQMENLPSNVTEQMIADHLADYSKSINPPQWIQIKLNRKKRSYAVVKLQTHEDAQMVWKNVNGTKLNGKHCKLDRFALTALFPDMIHGHSTGRNPIVNAKKLKKVENKIIVKEDYQTENGKLKKKLMGKQAKKRKKRKKAKKGKGVKV